MLTVRIAIERFVVKIPPALQAFLHTHGSSVACQDVPIELEVSRKILQLTKLARTPLHLLQLHLSNGVLASVGVAASFSGRALCPIFLFYIRII